MLMKAIVDHLVAAVAAAAAAAVAEADVMIY
jgi:hypothetical protein